MTDFEYVSMLAILGHTSTFINLRFSALWYVNFWVFMQGYIFETSLFSEPEDMIFL